MHERPPETGLDRAVHINLARVPTLEFQPRVPTQLPTPTIQQSEPAVFPMPQLAPEGQLSTQQIGDIRTEAGDVIPDVTIAYHRWGEYEESYDGSTNVVLIEHAQTGDSNAADWWCDLVGPGKAIDTDLYCVICTNVIGGCNGSTG